MTEHYEQLSILLAPRGRVPFIGPEKGREVAEGIARFDSPHGSRRYVVFHHGRIIGAAQFVEVRRGEVQLAHVFVAPEARRGGIGRRLLEAAHRDYDVVNPAPEEARSEAGDALSRAVFARNRRATPNRLVQLPRDEEIALAERILSDITDFIGVQLEEGILEYDQNLGDLTEEGYAADLYESQRIAVVVEGPCTKVPDRRDVSWGTGVFEPFFLRGSYSPRREHLRIVASSCRPCENWVDPAFHESRLRDFLDIWLHEQTHASDPGVRREIPGYIGAGRTLRTGDLPVAEYVNLPAEVKGFGRNVYEEATRQLEFIVTGGRGKLDPDVQASFLEHYRRRHGSAPARLLEKLITDTATWKSLSRIGLTPENHRRILRDVYQQLDADGWVQRLEEMLRG